MYNDTVTVFNRQGEMWLPAVLTGVHLAATRGAAPGRVGWERSSRALLLVPIDREGLVCGLEYAGPKRWAQLPDPGQAVTFAAGEEMFSVFLKGRWEDGPVADGDWPEGFYQKLRRERGGVWAAAEVTRYRALPHFEIVGR